MTKITISYKQLPEAVSALEGIGKTMKIVTKKGPKTGAEYKKIYLECEPKSREKGS